MTAHALERISDHVYWLPPAKPDRPSLCAVVGRDRTLMLDAGASDAHARLFLKHLTAVGVAPPSQVALTHWHWDHVFGAAEVGAQLIAQARTAGKLAELATRDWSDAGLEQHIALGEQTAAGAEDLKTELPAPRLVRIAQPQIVFREALELRLGGVTCQIAHVGGDHAADSSVMFIMPDRVLFLGDCMYDTFYGRTPHYTARLMLPLLDRLEAFEAEYYVRGHDPAVLTRTEFENVIGKMRLAVKLVEEFGSDEGVVFPAAKDRTGEMPDGDLAYFLRRVIAGLTP
jgi:glyoxylase-like metal-dependent hydrolase (beta-lactamase superfamily II)